MAKSSRTKQICKLMPKVTAEDRDAVRPHVADIANDTCFWLVNRRIYIIAVHTSITVTIKHLYAIHLRESDKVRIFTAFAIKRIVRNDSSPHSHWQAAARILAASD